MMKQITIIILIVFQIISFSCNGQSTDIDNEYCRCNDNSIEILKSKLKQIDIKVCGYESQDTSSVIKEYGGINVLNCNKKSTMKISDLDNVNWFQIDTYSDTLFFNFHISSVKIKPSILYQIVLFENNDTIQIINRFDKNFRFATINEKRSLRKEYLSFKIDESDNDWETKIASLGWQLFYCAISGDNEAKDRLFHSEKYYENIQGAFLEELLYYSAIYVNLKDLRILKD